MGRKKKILFVTPPYHAGVVEVAGRWVPLNMVYLVAAARAAGWDAVVYDAMTKGVGHAEIEAKIKEVKPDVVATGAITCTLPDALRIMQGAKRIDKNIITILGGIHPSFMAEEAFSLCPRLDYIVRGEGEITLRELLTAIEGGLDVASVKGIAYKEGGEVKLTEERPLMEPLEFEKLPKAWDALDWADYNYFIIPGSRLGALDTSRGCNKECTFCSQRKFWRESWRARSPESLIADIEDQKKHGVNVVLLTDDYPTYDRARWERFLDLLIERNTNVFLLMETRVEDILRDADILSKYRKAGIIHIYVGTEATDQATLDLFKKDVKVDDARKALKLLNDHGIITETSMILGLPHETKDSIERTLGLAKLYNADFCHFLAIAPWPYADMYKELKDRVKVFDYKRYNLIDPIVEPDNMTLDDIDRAIVDCYRRFYMDKLKEVIEIPDDFKREYMLVSMRLMMTSSFLVNKLGDLGKMPEEVARYMDKLMPEKKAAAV
ncbi:MAG: cobalamin-dependent protein [Deltaproteobacteria bacterium]|nr:cobalamin-dependent protein [Deltaproteobacteria bacterium]